MSDDRVFLLDAIRTDGWFERIGQGIGSFQSLCDIVGERFFAFSMITGARITALTVDRRNPDQTLVDFVVGGDTDEGTGDPQRLTLPEFRRRLVAALVVEGAGAPAPERDTDLEGLQLHIGVRYLLLAPLFGFSLRALHVSADGSALEVVADGREARMRLEAFQLRIRALVREELERATAGQRATIDLAQVAEAEAASIDGNWHRVLQLLGAWPAPLAIFLRTPEGQALSPEASSLIAKGLGFLGTAFLKLGDIERAEEVYRLGIQYGQDTSTAADIFVKLGEGFLADGRPGEAIAPLRRAVVLGASARLVQPMLARAFLRRSRLVAAYSCVRAALDAGVPQADLADELREIERSLGPALTAWRARMLAPVSPPVGAGG
jgi:tetratricopeptide (TPR) repeat protein